MNLIGFGRVPHGTTAFELLELLGGANVVASISRFDRSTGRYQSAVLGPEPTGENILINRGEAYWVSVR
jgi:hypothetical protein